MLRHWAYIILDRLAYRSYQRLHSQDKYQQVFQTGLLKLTGNKANSYTNDQLNNHKN
jgi:hypothetical protein